MLKHALFHDGRLNCDFRQTKGNKGCVLNNWDYDWKKGFRYLSMYVSGREWRLNSSIEEFNVSSGEIMPRFNLDRPVHSDSSRENTVSLDKFKSRDLIWIQRLYVALRNTHLKGGPRG